MANLDETTDEVDDLARVFLAVTLKEAQQVEALLRRVGVEYVVEVEEVGNTLLGSPRHGAIFLVPSGQAAYCGAKLLAAGLEIGLLIEVDRFG